MMHHFVKARECFHWESWTRWNWCERGPKMFPLFSWLWFNICQNIRGLRCFLRGKHLWHLDEGWASPDSGGEEWHCVCCGRIGRHIYY